MAVISEETDVLPLSLVWKPALSLGWTLKLQPLSKGVRTSVSAPWACVVRGSWQASLSRPGHMRSRPPDSLSFFLVTCQEGRENLGIVTLE